MPDKITNNCLKFKQILHKGWNSLTQSPHTQKLLHTVISGDCILCGAFEQAPHHSLCQSCLDSLPYHHKAQCPVCALPSPQHQICGRCLKRPPAFDHTHAIFDYTFPIMPMLQRYKYQQALPIGHCLTKLVLQQWQATLPYDGLIPMPLHINRLKSRGFNQTQLLGKSITRQTGIPLWDQHCERRIDTPSQAGLSLKARLKNIRNAFHTDQRFDGKCILLLDDVMTTGASLNALATVLKSAGAERVDCLVIARTLPVAQQP